MIIFAIRIHFDAAGADEIWAGWSGLVIANRPRYIESDPLGSYFRSLDIGSYNTSGRSQNLQSIHLIVAIAHSWNVLCAYIANVHTTLQLL